MDWLLDPLASLVAFLGHFSLAVWLFNRLHAMPWPRPAIKVLERLILLVAAGVLGIYFLRLIAVGVCVSDGQSFVGGDVGWLIYPAVCAIAAAAAIPLWVIPKLLAQVPDNLVTNDTVTVDLALRLGKAPAGARETALCAAIPGNEIFRLAIHQKLLRLNRLPKELAGLTIAHLSDLHMTGRFTREFYEEIVEQSNRLLPDLVVITGDIVEKVACLDWIVPLLSRLQAKSGKFFILGNHEMKLPDVPRLRKLMEQAGFLDAGSRTIRHQVQGTEMLIAGTEVPWFGTLPNTESLEVRGQRSEEWASGECQPPVSFAPRKTREFRLLLSHSPDTLPWARRNDFDLMLAGHTHGGQIRLPFIGALISPSRYGFRYAGGLYYEAPTLLHVSRGLCGVHPLRFNCPPELALLTLTTG